VRQEIADSNVNKEFEVGTVLTAVALSHSGRMVFAGTEGGAVRSYKFPLSGEFQEYLCHARPVAALAVTYDDAFLFSIGEDGAVFVIDVRDKDVRLAKRDKEMLAWAEEILVTKSDLEEKNGAMNDLRQKVDELILQNDYQLRLKDMTHAEKVKEMTDRYTSELESGAEGGVWVHAVREDAVRPSASREKRHGIRVRGAAARAGGEGRGVGDGCGGDVSKQVCACFCLLTWGRLMAEMERFNKLVEEKEALNERWDEQNSLLVESHERLIQELTGGEGGGGGLTAQRTTRTNCTSSRCWWGGCGRRRRSWRGCWRRRGGRWRTTRTRRLRS
jgi:cilia- and flagella-associated protein 57